MLHKHEASVEKGRVEGGRVGDGNKRGRNGARHGRREGGSDDVRQRGSGSGGREGRLREG